MRSDARVLPVEREHIDLVAEGMRAEDVQEVHASGGYTPRQAIEISVAASSFARTLVVDDHVLAIYGVVPARPETVLGAPDVGIAWMLTTTSVARFPVTFYRLSRPAILGLLDVHSTLYNMVDARYEKALRWAKRVGFYVGEPVPFGAAKLPFRQIVLRKDEFHV